MPIRAEERIRDAERSREAILEAAERLFSEQGYDRASLGDIAAAAGLSRGTPSYFFGSKERLYIAVLDRAYRDRQIATEAAFEPVHEWCSRGGTLDGLRAALASAANDYMHFLARHRSFVRLVLREELGGGQRMQARTARSTAMQDAFEALHRDRRRLGLRAFNVADAVLLFVSLTFAPFSYRNTLMRAVGRDPKRPADLAEQIELAVDQLMHLLAP